MDKPSMQFEDGGQKKPTKSVIYIVSAIIIIIVAICVGIGIGFAIRNGQGKDTSSAEKQISPTGKPSSPSNPNAGKSWMEVSCFTGDQPKCPKGVSSPPLILISLDGFRPDYLERGFTPVLKRISQCGVSTPFMLPSFPSLTFPNHYTSVTGLYPESHGIVGNTMYDPDINKVFCIKCSQIFNSDWWGGEPIWNTVVKQDKIGASFFWAGSDVKIAETRPDFYLKYDHDTTYDARVDTVTGWLSLPDGKRYNEMYVLCQFEPDLIHMYFDEPDHTGHEPGPDTDALNEVLRDRVDPSIERLMDSIVDLGMENCVNIMIMADHGMANRSCDQVYNLRDYIDSDDYYTKNTGGTMLRIDPKSDAVIKEPKEIVETLKCKHPAAVAHLKQDGPKRWHYMNHKRIEDVLVPIEAGWTTHHTATTWCDGGTHGYDNLSPYVKALFMAYGPAFKPNFQVEPFQNIELYNLMCDVLDIEPAPNNGTAGSLHHLLNHPKSLPPLPVPIGSPVECLYPSSEQEYNDRIAQDTSGCKCNLGNNIVNTVQDFDAQLDLTNTEAMTAKEKHGPFGLPQVDFESNYCELFQSNYITGFSHDINMPLFVSYTVEDGSQSDSIIGLANCTVRPDVRTDMSPHCTDYAALSGDLENITMSFLYPPEIPGSIEGAMNARSTSNLVPQFPGFVEDLWNVVANHLPLWANEYNGINVISGPIFDYNFDGIRDNKNTTDKEGVKYGSTLLPTHYFVVVTRCASGKELNKDCEKLKPLTFILQNKDGIRTCEHPMDYLQRNIATIQDVEILTGLRLFPDLPRYDSISLKHEIYIKGKLWKEWTFNN